MSTISDLASAQKQDLDLPRNIHLFWIVQIGLIFPFLDWLWVYYKRGYRDACHMWPIFGFVHGGDFFIWRYRFSFVHSLEFFSTSPSIGPRYTYTAPSGLVYTILYHLGGYGCFLGITLGGLLALAIIACLILRSRGVATWKAVLLLGAVTLLSYASWLEWMDGNLEAIVFLIVAAGLIAFLRGHNDVAAILFGFAGAMKFYPFLFFGLFVKKPVKPYVIGAVVAVTSTLISLWVLCPSIPDSAKGIAQSLAYYRWAALLTPSTLAPWDHSLYCAIRDVGALLRFGTPGKRFLDAYLATAACVGIVLFFTVIRKLPVLNQICALTIAAIWLTPTSIDYTLLHLFLPAFLLMLLSIDAKRAGVHVAGLTGCLLCAALLFAPENELIYHGKYGCGGFIKAIVLLVFFVLTLRFRLELPTTVSFAGLPTHEDFVQP